MFYRNSFLPILPFNRIITVDLRVSCCRDFAIDNHFCVPVAIFLLHFEHHLFNVLQLLRRSCCTVGHRHSCIAFYKLSACDLCPLYSMTTEYVLKMGH